MNRSGQKLAPARDVRVLAILSITESKQASVTLLTLLPSVQESLSDELSQAQ